MAVADSTAFPIYGQAFRFTGRIVGYSTGNPITGGLTSVTAQVSKDGGSFASTTNSVTEIGTSGYFHLTLTAAEMTANGVIVRVTASNSGAVEFCTEIRPVDMRENSGYWGSQSVVKMEQVLVQLSAYFFNLHTLQLNSETIKKRDNSTTLLSGSVSQDDATTTASRGPMA